MTFLRLRGDAMLALVVATACSRATDPRNAVNVAAGNGAMVFSPSSMRRLPDESCRYSPAFGCRPGVQCTPPEDLPLPCPAACVERPPSVPADSTAWPCTVDPHGGDVEIPARVGVTTTAECTLHAPVHCPPIGATTDCTPPIADQRIPCARTQGPPGSVWVIVPAFDVRDAQGHCVRYAETRCQAERPCPLAPPQPSIACR